MRATSFLIQRLAIDVQRGNAASVMATIPATKDWAKLGDYLLYNFYLLIYLLFFVVVVCLYLIVFFIVVDLFGFCCIHCIVLYSLYCTLFTVLYCIHCIVLYSKKIYI